MTERINSFLTRQFVSRRSWLKGTLSLASLLGLAKSSTAQSPARRPPFFATLFACEPTATSAILQARIATALVPPGEFSTPSPGAAGEVRFEIAERSNFTGARFTPWLRLSPDADFIARSTVTELRPRTPYFYRAHYRGADGRSIASVETGTFSTLPDPASRESVSFIVTSCMSYAHFFGEPQQGAARQGGAGAGAGRGGGAGAGGRQGGAGAGAVAAGAAANAGEGAGRGGGRRGGGAAAAAPEGSAAAAAPAVPQPGAAAGSVALANRGRAATPAERQRGYPSWDHIRQARPQFVVQTGDTVYYNQGFVATTLDELRQKWHQQFSLPSVREAMASAATFFMKDDHDFRGSDDSDNSGAYLPSPELGKRVFLEQTPAGIGGRTYRTARVNRHVQIWMVEGRDFRSPNDMADTPDKTIWGIEQRNWLERTLRESDATFKLIITPTPIVGPDDSRKRDNMADPGGFQVEGEKFLQFLKDAGMAASAFIITGDRHWKYHTIHPLGIEEFATGTLHRHNGRLGVAPGEGTDPDALIRQPYLQPVPDGGFLQIDVEQHPEFDGVSLLVRMWSEAGALQYATRRFSAANASGAVGPAATPGGRGGRGGGGRGGVPVD